MTSPKVHFQALLRVLFRLNWADFDFGVYRLANAFRPALEHIIDEDLDREVGEALARNSLDSQDSDALYAHLASFFEQCARIERPLKRGRGHGNGSFAADGTTFTWEDSNQYFVSSSPTERRIRVKIGDCSVTIHAGRTNIVKGNVDKNTYYWVLAEDSVRWDEGQKELFLTLEFRPLVPSEQKIYAGSRGRQLQILEEVVIIVWQFTAATPLANEINQEDFASRLLWNLQYFTKLGTIDHFIHRDLENFLNVQWESYVVEHFLRPPRLLDDFQDGPNHAFNKELGLASATMEVAHQVARILIRLEKIQRDLFLAPKTLEEVGYCVPWATLSARLQELALNNPVQQAEWQDLYNLSSDTVISIPPQTPVDTRYFDESFKQEILGNGEDSLAVDGGLAICGDNFHALNLLRNSYSNQVKLIYIDPPYNKGNNEFLYRDGYRPETWDILMENALLLARDLLCDEGLIFVSIDDNRVHELALLMKKIFGPSSHVATMPVKSNPRGRSMERFVATTHEYLLLFAKNPEAMQIADNELTENQLGEYNKLDPALGPYRLIELRNRNPEFHRGNRPNLHYPIYYDSNTGEFDIEAHPRWAEIRPKTSQGKDAVWRWSKEKFLANRDRIVIKRMKRAENPYNVYKKDFLHQDSGEVRRSKHKTFLEDNAYNYQNGKRAVRDMFGEALFGNPKPLALIDKCLAIANLGDGSIVMDFFAGSGTTGHAIIDRMRRTGMKINYILVELGQIFYDALLPRLKKASFAQEWNNGIPQDTNSVPHVIKYAILQNYDEAFDRGIEKLKGEGAKL